MKTILYQPLFINPQAYFVFPQLYHLDSNVTFGEVLFINNSYKNDNVFANANVIQFNNIKRQ